MGKIKPQALLVQSKKKKGPSQISLSTIIIYCIVIILIALSLYAGYTRWFRSNYQLGTGVGNIEIPETLEANKT